MGFDNSGGGTGDTLDGLCFSRRSELVLDIADLLASAFGGKTPVIQVEDMTVALEAVKRRGELKDAYFKSIDKEKDDGGDG